MAAVMWFRRDLRLADNPALLDAVAAGDGRVAGVFVLDPALWDAAGDPRRAQLLSSLRSLSAAMDGKLVVRRGDPATVIPELAAELGAASVHVTTDYGPYGVRRDQAVENALSCPLVATGSPYAVAPGRILNGQGRSYQVFTPYFRAWLEHGWRQPAEAPATIEWIAARGDALPAAGTIEGAGEVAAREHWTQWLASVGQYDDERNRPDLDSTSRMSVPLKYGEIHPRTMLTDLARHPGAGADAYRRELAWRDFCADLLARYPQAAWKPLRPEFERMVYDEPGDAFTAWCEGRTGYPIVDAGMRQLAASGFVHNRIRMVVASFLVKDLHVHWKYGARWFMARLRDGDLASNSLNWQWVAGCGADPSPYYRVFNPITQGLKFDPDGSYVRRWVPELADLPGKSVHEPWKLAAPPAGYPAPIVDHAEARLESLRRYDAIT
ncbi:Deoxyribodipyrimidine photo-lyase [Kribbella flavida DSM 17836]|uniref:Deoxyribodipyrimidine photo-lyase n=1 Tax=Kribbella flavida (strain DSM 17836 / JCM 10339 / NBRC 14399) TaxID=479435 RepID=D2PRF8_KRIFD|nr:deoxyribodipyrimidine photo-lyase [Kribbella flavida]ADB34876.1 Deoxyribodipyrimidine photo-lyase [Kribbella flavida DSM 17836]